MDVIVLPHFDDAVFPAAACPPGASRTSPFGTRVWLEPHVMELKLAMVSCHQSQVREMMPEFPGMPGHDGPMRTEVFWTHGEELPPR
jgi:hypothetical protein